MDHPRHRMTPRGGGQAAVAFDTVPEVKSHYASGDGGRGKEVEGGV